MIDSQKLDTFFDNRQPFEETQPVTPAKIVWRRWIKLVLPCVAAALLGVMMVMPNIKKNVELATDVTIPRKGEMEKLHIEKTEFNILDNKNRVNKIIADHVDEEEPGSQKYKIINPKGYIPTDKDHVDITSDIGYFNQKNNVLDLQKNVKAVVDGNTVITTAAASYDFDKEKGWGKVPVKAKGDWGTMNAEAFSYDKAAEVLVLKGKNRIDSTRGILTAEKETQVYQKENKVVAIGKAHIFQENNNLFADKIIGWFTKNSKKELERAEAYGNVLLQTPKEKITGNEGYYFAKEGRIEVYATARNAKQQNGWVNVEQGSNTLRARQITAYVSTDGKNDLQKVVAVGDVVVITPEEKISGQKGIYEPSKGRVEMYGANTPVQIKQGENTLHAQKVIAFLSKDGKKQLQYAEAIGEVEVITPKGSAWGDKGIYNPQKKKVELYDNVRLEQNGNFIRGAHAETDLETSVSRITGDENTAGRIHGTFYKKGK